MGAHEIRRSRAGARALALAACATTGRSRRTAPASAIDDDPYPSTYRAYPGAPTALVGATVYDGAGGRIDDGTVLFAEGKVVGVGGPELAIPAGYTRIDGSGKFVTPGIIDIHSHLGDYPSPSVAAHDDGNEATDPTTPEVWAEHSVWPQDPGFTRALANGGVTALQILPGSANLMGGRSVTLKNVPARTVQGMKFPGAPYWLKMACGENPKRVYGGKGRMPSTRMGNFAVNRQTWLDAREYADGDAQEARPRQGDARRRARRRDPGPEPLLPRRRDGAGARYGQGVGLQASPPSTTRSRATRSPTCCATNGVCSAVWADWYGFKMEAYDGIPENAALIHNAGACVVIHSDDENGIQRLNQEAAKAQAAGRRMGIDIPDAAGDRLVHAQRRRRRWASPSRPAASSRARWPTWCCGTAIRCRSTRGPRRCGSTARCCSTRSIPRAAR